MKKYIAIMLTLAAVLMLMVGCGGGSDEPVTDLPQTGSNEDYFLWDDDTTIEGLTELGKKQTHLTIPENCVAVSILCDSSFESISFENPDTQIENFAFSGCTQLKRIELPENLDSIGWGCFEDCTSLEEIVIPGSVTEIDDEAFVNCTALKKVVFSDNLETVCRGAFEGCTALESVALPDSLKEIEKKAFTGCTALKTVSFGAAVEIIGESAFEGCTALEIVQLPESVKTIERYAFAFCDALTEVYLPASLETMDNTALAQTHNFKLYVVSGSLADQMIGEMMGNEYMETCYQ